MDEFADTNCQACGVYDASLRQSIHPVVVSTLTDAGESARVGIWCARCRGIEATKAAAVSLFAGWWSWHGPKRTIAALQTNLRGGEQRATANAQMLRSLARDEYDRGNPELASMFARAAHSVQPQRENSRLVDELNRGGYRNELPRSPWRFAPFVPVVVAAILLGTFVINIASSDEIEAPPATAVHQVAVAASAAKPTERPYERKQAWLTLSADELEKQLTSEYDRDLARAYFNARLQESRSQIPIRVRNGDDLRAMHNSMANLSTHPGVAPLLKQYGLRSKYDKLMTVMNDSTRYYRGGPSIDAMQRTAGESINVTLDMTFETIVSDMRGYDERTNALASEVQRRAASLEEMRTDMRIRKAVMAFTDKAISDCLAASGG
jgi:hypothetical protein